MEGLQTTLGNPDLAYLLLMLSLLGISIEILTPGLIFPSLFGIISGLFAFLALNSLPVNPLGIILILISLGLFVAEALVRTRGIVTLLGVISVGVGSVFLFKGGEPNRADPFLIACTVIVMASCLVFIANRVVTAQRLKVGTGREAFKGSTAVVRTELHPEGLVYFQGELWKAALDGDRAVPGDEVIITGLEGLKLFVTKIRR